MRMEDARTTAELEVLMDSLNQFGVCKNNPQPLISLCDDLSRLSCKPGMLDDGTGFSWRGVLGEYRKYDRAEVEAYTKKYFEAHLSEDSKLVRAVKKYCEKNQADQKLLDCAVSYGTDLAMLEDPHETDEKYIKETSRIKKIVDHLKKHREDRIFGPFYRELQEKITEPDLDKEVAKDMEDVKKSLVSILKKSNLNEVDKKKMIKKIEDIKFAGTNCTSTNVSMKTKLDPLLTSNAYYHEETNEFRYCNGMDRTNHSRFNRYFIIAHELAHSIDPTAVIFTPQNKVPYPGLVSCLRSERSVHARMNEPNQPYFDQIGESFADFAATEVLADLMKDRGLSKEQYQNGVANVLRDGYICDSPNDPIDDHPLYADRINKIVMANPTMKRLTGCEQKTPVNYCGSTLGF